MVLLNIKPNTLFFLSFHSVALMGGARCSGQTGWGRGRRSPGAVGKLGWPAYLGEAVSKPGAGNLPHPEQGQPTHYGQPGTTGRPAQCPPGLWSPCLTASDFWCAGWHQGHYWWEDRQANAPVCQSSFHQWGLQYPLSPKAWGHPQWWQECFLLHQWGWSH